MINIEMFPARDGDCFLVNYGNNSENHILIDGGRKETYENFLKKRLKEINSKGEEINLLIVTHIDSDHIEGIIELLKENEGFNSSKIVKINEIWHNGFCNIVNNKNKKAKITDYEEGALEEIIAANSNNYCDISNEEAEISYKQGNSLYELIIDGNYRWNETFERKAINFDLKKEVIIDELKIKILSPNSKKLESLNKKWKDKLDEYRDGFNISNEKIMNNAFELYMKNYSPIISDEEDEIAFCDYSKKSFLELLSMKHKNDTSVTNGASISFIIEYGNQKVLFLGDCHIGIVKKRIENLIQTENYNTFFDVIKLSHHGSINNISKDLLKLIDGYKYLISTDGSKHGHPDLPVFSWIVGRDKKIHRKLLFNYSNHATEYYDKEEYKEKYNYSIFYPANPNKIESTIIEI
jgi:beta-lactamase superfamily II metal-dependent hydrolase